jgi:hypothetical protein
LQDKKVIGAIPICTDMYGLKDNHEITIAEKYSYTTILTKIIISAFHKHNYYFSIVCIQISDIYKYLSEMCMRFSLSLFIYIYES